MTPSEHFEFTLERRRLASLAEDALCFRRSAGEALDELLCRLIGQNSEIGNVEFHTPHGRRCVLMIGIGDDAFTKIEKFSDNVIQKDE